MTGFVLAQLGIAPGLPGQGGCHVLVMRLVRPRPRGAVGLV